MKVEDRNLGIWVPPDTIHKYSEIELLNVERNRWFHRYGVLYNQMHDLKRYLYSHANHRCYGHRHTRRKDFPHLTDVEHQQLCDDYKDALTNIYTYKNYWPSSFHFPSYEFGGPYRTIHDKNRLESSIFFHKEQCYKLQICIKEIDIKVAKVHRVLSTISDAISSGYYRNLY